MLNFRKKIYWSFLLLLILLSSPLTLKANPLIRGSQLEHGVFEWDQIKPEHVIPAFKYAISKAQERVQVLINNPEEPNFENTIVALEFVDPEFNYVAGAYYGLRSVLQEQYNPIASEAQALVDAYSSDLSRNKQVFARIKKVYDKRHQMNLAPHQLRLLEGRYESYVREGVNQSPEVIAELAEIDDQLGQHFNRYLENATKSKETYQLHVVDERLLQGLSERFLERARQRAEEQAQKGWIITLDDYVDVLNNADNSALRKPIWQARRKVAYKNGPDGQHPEYDNRQTVLQIVKLRQKRAKILGFKNHAEYALQDKMAKTPERVSQFLDDFFVQIKPAAQRELSELKAFKKAQGGSSEIQPWDLWYWETRHKEHTLNLDLEEVRQYFSFEKVLKDGVMKQGKLFWDIDFVERKDLPTYHEDVVPYEAQINGKTIGFVYLDPFARKGKRSGAWVAPLRSHHIGEYGQEVVPVMILVLNIAEAPEGQPNLLSIGETTTVFHEMGHAYQGLLSRVEYQAQNGVARDFVEVPSQVPENLVYERPILELFAYHHQTGEVISPALIAQIKAVKDYGAARFELGQMSLADVDMKWYTSVNLPDINGVFDFESEALARTRLIFSNEDGLISTNFGHIFTGGYHAGYYGYQWARVIGADLYAAFIEDGEFSLEQAREVAGRFRDHILSQGDRAEALDLFKNFRGREPDPKYFLKQIEAP